MSYTIIGSPIGDLTLVVDSATNALTGVYMTEHRHRPPLERFGERVEGPGGRQIFGAVTDQLAEYFAGERRVFDLTLHSQGTPFQSAVWSQLLEIPYGHTISYATLATHIANPKAVRAVGLANGRNPLSIVVPCHRVVGTNGSLTGFGGGIERKRFLLALERGEGVTPLIEDSKISLTV